MQLGPIKIMKVWGAFFLELTKTSANKAIYEQNEGGVIFVSVRPSFMINFKDIGEGSAKSSLFFHHFPYISYTK